MASNAAGRNGLVALWSRYANAAMAAGLAGGGHAVGFGLVRRHRSLGDAWRKLALEHIVQGHRAQKGVDLVAELLPQIMGQAFAAIGPAARAIQAWSVRCP